MIQLDRGSLFIRMSFKYNDSAEDSLSYDDELYKNCHRNKSELYSKMCHWFKKKIQIATIKKETINNFRF